MDQYPTDWRTLPAERYDYPNAPQPGPKVLLPPVRYRILAREVVTTPAARAWSQPWILADMPETVQTVWTVEVTRHGRYRLDDSDSVQTKRYAAESEAELVAIIERDDCNDYADYCAGD